MRVTLPELTAPAMLVFGPEDRLSDDAYFAFCGENPDLNLERTADSKIAIGLLAGGESAFRMTEAVCELIPGLPKTDAEETSAPPLTRWLRPFSRRGLGIEAPAHHFVQK